MCECVCARRKWVWTGRRERGREWHQTLRVRLHLVTQSLRTAIVKCCYQCSIKQWNNTEITSCKIAVKERGRNALLKQVCDHFVFQYVEESSQLESEWIWVPYFSSFQRLRVWTVGQVIRENCGYLPWMSSVGWTWCLESAGAASRSPSHCSQSSLIPWWKKSLKTHTHTHKKTFISSNCVRSVGNLQL